MYALQIVWLFFPRPEAELHAIDSDVHEKSEEHGMAMNIKKTMTVIMETRGMEYVQTIVYRKALE